MRSTNAMSCSTTTSECSPASETKSSAVRSVSSSLMPATGSSSSSSCGSCMSSMPISSHCFWPCDSSPRAVAGSARRTRSSVAAMRSRSRSELREERAAHALVGLHRELEVLERAVVLEDRRLLELAPDAGVRDLRLGKPREVDGLAEERAPASGRVLPVITSIIVVLPAPLGR
jgi:hypothetical protein